MSDDAATVVDARGLRCPLPVIRLAQAAEGLTSGTLVLVLASDPAAEHDVPAWARMRGHRVVDTHHTDDGTLTLTVELGPGQAAGPP